MIQLVQMNAFIDPIKAYFHQAYGDEVKVKSAYLANKPEADLKDYTAKISIGGESQANVYFSATRIMMMQMLIAAGHANPTDAVMSKAFNRIMANLKAAASQFFVCESAEISVTHLTNSALKVMTAQSLQPYVVKLMWRNQEITMLFDI